MTTAPGGGAAGGGAAPAAAAESGQALQYAVPDGWTQIPPAQFRDPNFIIDGIEGSEVYVTELPGGGGLVANVNRWRGQLGLDALAPEEVTARTHLDFLGGHGVLVDFSGTYSGMAPIAGGGGEPAGRAVGFFVCRARSSVRSVSEANSGQRASLTRRVIRPR